MPKRDDIKKIMIIGAGPIVIGQACEFDYSGVQACKALKEEGYEVVLVNSNPATIMTDPDMADATYIEPLTESVIEKIMKLEKPDALLPTVGGQTALNLSMNLHQSGVLKKLNIEMIGARPDAIQKAEGRESFKKAMESIGLESAKSIVAYTLDEAKSAAKVLHYPCVVRPAFTLGGTGGGIVNDETELVKIVSEGLRSSLISEVLIEESLIGWKEFELEVVRDKKDNVVIICSIENIDPMGIHTGDSITVAPAQTLTDKEFQKMRNASIEIMREIGVDTGGSNVQFALNPENGRMLVIEMNPRVSRSSALASKATGFPIAKLAAKLAVGYTLDELKNDITKHTSACFEPTLDYVVVKIPRFDYQKFSKTPFELGTAMKSVGEAMAIGRTFKEAIQKAFRSLEMKRFGFGFDGEQSFSHLSDDELWALLDKRNQFRLFYIHEGLMRGFSVEKLYQSTKIDHWFLYQLKEIVKFSNQIQLNKTDIREAKRKGFSDYQLARLLGEENEYVFRKKRLDMGIKPTYALVDTCAGEFEAYTPYYYSSYETQDERLNTNKEKVMILGGGPNRIGQGIEFDYCCVHASFAVKEGGYESLMVNSNPETVSTDFDCSDKLFFEPLTFEDVLNIYEAESPKGVIVQFGGQTPLNLSLQLEKAGVKILGTSSESIDRAEDRKKSQELLEICQLKQPENGIARTIDDAIRICQKIDYPVVVRPSYVIGGTSMRIIKSEAALIDYMEQFKYLAEEKPLLIDEYLVQAIEVDVDCLSDGKEAMIAGIMEHIEEAGIHSGDSACVYPPYSLSKAMCEEIKMAAIKLAKELKIIGLLNIQFAIKEDVLYVLEVNPRASRTIPFISKASGIPWAKFATKVILGSSISQLNIPERIPAYYSVKESVFPFNRFENVDTLLGPEMKSTGEVMGIDVDFAMSYHKAQLAASQVLPQKGTVFVTVRDEDKSHIIEHVSRLIDLGFDIVSTVGTAQFLKEQGMHVNVINKISDGGDHSLKLMRDEKIQLVINLADREAMDDEVLMRREALMLHIPLISTVSAILASINAIKAVRESELTVQSIQNYYRSY